MMLGILHRPLSCLQGVSGNLIQKLPESICVFVLSLLPQQIDFLSLDARLVFNAFSYFLDSLGLVFKAVFVDFALAVVLDHPIRSRTFDVGLHFLSSLHVLISQFIELLGSFLTKLFFKILFKFSTRLDFLSLLNRFDSFPEFFLRPSIIKLQLYHP